MKRLIIGLICIMTAALLLTACGTKKNATEEDAASKAKLVGEWEQISEDGSPSLPEMGIPSGYVFNADNTGLDTFWDLTFKYTVTEDTLHIIYDDRIADETDYEYIIEDDVLTMTRTSEDAVSMMYEKLSGGSK